MNNFIVSAHVSTHLKLGVNLEDLTETINFRGKHAYFVQDNSYIWDEQQHRDEPIEIADALFEFIAGLAKTEDSLLDSLLDVFRDHVWFAFFWKRLIKTACMFPKVFAPRLFELCTAKPILMGNDALYELGLFLQVAASEFTPEQLLQIEEAILGLPSEDEQNREYLVNQRNRLLAQIPTPLLNTDESNRIREGMDRDNSVPENRPLVSFGPVTWSNYTEEEWLQDQGVDTTTLENQELQVFFGSLDRFHSNWSNEPPIEEAAEAIFPLLQEAYAAIKSETEADKEVIDRLWYKLTACTAILGRVAGDYGSHLLNFCRNVLLAGATHELPKPDSERDAKFESSGYSPFPRHEASKGLLRLSVRQSDSEILDAIELLANDSVPSVRMVTAMGLFMTYYKTPDRFWQIVQYRAMHETIPAVQGLICTTMAQVVGSDKENEDRTACAMDKILKRIFQHAEQVEPTVSFIDLLMWFAISRENPWALKTIEDNFLKSPIRYVNALNRAVFWVMKQYVNPKNLETKEERETMARAIDWLGKVITVASDEIHHLCVISKDGRSEEITEKLHEVYKAIDEVVMRLYFAAAHQKSGTEEPVEEIPHSLRREFYDQVKPLMEKVIEFALDEEHGVMFAKTAYRFMQLLTSFLSCNPTEVLHLAAGVAISSERFGYNLDAVAVQDVVKFVEIVLADHRSEVREGQALEDLLILLDIFAKAGWSDALKLVWRLDEVFR